MIHKENYAEGWRKNSLGSLRLILAVLVVFEHRNNLFHVAQGVTTRFSFFLLNMSDVAVSCFFVISGMLPWISISFLGPDQRPAFSQVWKRHEPRTGFHPSPRLVLRTTLST